MNPPPPGPLYVIGVRNIILYLREYNEIEDLGLDRKDGRGVVMILSDALNWRTAHGYGQLNGNYEPWMNLGSCVAITPFDICAALILRSRSREAADDLCAVLGLESFTTVDVYHRTRCYGAVLKHTDGWSLVYVLVRQYYPLD